MKSIKYLIPAVLMLILGAGLLLLPEKQKTKETAPNQLLAELFDQTRYVSTDRVAERLINQDPALFLIDVRMADYYQEYSLPGAVNIPLEDILNPDWKDYLAQEGMDIVFFANSDLSAEQAWMLAKRMGYHNLYVMKGGLNRWFETIIKPQKPAETASGDEFELYDFRRGASQYFTGGGQVDSDNAIAEPVIVSRKKKKNAVEGGC